MSLTDLLWPWGALRRERSARCRAARDIHALELRVEAYEYKIGEQEQKTKEVQLRLLLAENEVAKLRKILATAHFRDPKTGRISKKGQPPQ